MIRKVCITLFSLFATVGVFVAFGQSPVQQDENGRASVDFRADQMSRIKVGDSSALCLVGHVVFFHNGAVIMCDSAVRYSERQRTVTGMWWSIGQYVHIWRQGRLQRRSERGADLFAVDQDGG